jgi:hypothetical protein
MDKQDKGLELACRFSLITNKLRYCGPREAHKDFYLLLIGKKYDKNKIKKHFRGYEGLYVYLRNIAKKHHKNPFDYDVIEAYWIGNGLLNSFTKKDLQEIILELTKRGLPEYYADKLIEKIPKGMNPSHSFNVLFVGVGKTTGAVPTNIITMNKCVVSIGEVLKIQDNSLVVAVNTLKIKRGLLKYGRRVIQHIEYIKESLPNINVNDKIAVHWNFACKILTEREVYNLRKTTQRNIDALNEALFFSNV